MKIPHKIRITSKCSYEIVWVDRFDDIEQRGECWYDSKAGVRQIRILKGMCEKLTFETLLHELFHAFEYETKGKIPHATIYLLEQAVHRILRLNGWMPKK
jgi:hypothetical protein